MVVFRLFAGQMLWLFSLLLLCDYVGAKAGHSTGGYGYGYGRPQSCTSKSNRRYSKIPCTVFEVPWPTPSPTSDHGKFPESSIPAPSGGNPTDPTSPSRPTPTNGDGTPSQPSMPTPTNGSPFQPTPTQPSTPTGGGGTPSQPSPTQPSVPTPTGGGGTPSQPTPSQPSVPTPTNGSPSQPSPTLPSAPTIGSPTIGSPSNGLPTIGSPTNGPPSNGSPTNGLPTIGSPTNGSPSNGSPSNGSPTNGPPTNGPPSNGSPTNGLPTNGSPSNGSPTIGSPSSGSPSNGSPTNGLPTNGSPSNGSPTNGLPTNGSPSNGSPTNGSPSNGSPSNGSPSNGSPTGGVPPSEASVSCRSQGGVFGQVSGESAPITYGYQLEIEASAQDVIETEILPALETQYTDFLLPELFPGECLVDTRRRDRFRRLGTRYHDGEPRAAASKRWKLQRKQRRLSVVGISSRPQDELRGPCDDTTGSNTCYYVLGELTLYSIAGNRFLSDQETIRNAMETGMTNGEFNNAHPSIVRVSYVSVEEVEASNTQSDTIVDDGDMDTDDEVNAFAIWMISAAAVATLCIFGCGCLRCQSQDDDEEEGERSALSEPRNQSPGAASPGRQGPSMMSGSWAETQQQIS